MSNLPVTVQKHILRWSLPVFALACSALAPSRASGALVLTIETSGADVVAIVSGSVNTASLGSALHTTGSTLMIAAEGFLVAGGNGTSPGQQVQLDRYDTGVFGPSGFGTSDYYGQGNANTGAIAGFIVSPTNGSIYLPRNYVSGTALSGTTTWHNTSFATFGLLAGSSYTWTFGSGADTDTVTVNVVPEPSSLALVAMASAAALLRRRQRR